jgi:hypothetical protein
LINLCRKGNWLAVLAFFLYTPSNLDKTGLLEGVFIQIFDNALLLIVEDEVIGNESLDDRFTRWIGMMINLVLSGLGVFTQARSDVATESHEKEVTDWILAFAGYGHSTQLGKDFVVKRSTLPRNVLFL